MKQLLIASNKAYATAAAKYNDLTTVPDGTLAIFTLADGALVTTAAGLKSNFCVALGRGTGKAPLLFPEVDVKSMKVTKAEYAAGATFASTITVPTPVVGKTYTVVISKKGVVFNERSNWTFTEVAKTTTAADVASKIVAAINANKEVLGVTASNSGGAITIKATSAGPDYVVTGADELLGVKPTAVTVGKLAILDKEFVKDLASRCAAGKGFEYTHADGDSIYPGYPEAVDAASYTMFTLQFAVPRVGAKTRDEVVSQVLHICVPTGADAIATLNTIFGFTPPSSN